MADKELIITASGSSVDQLTLHSLPNIISRLLPVGMRCCPENFQRTGILLLHHLLRGNAQVSELRSELHL